MTKSKNKKEYAKVSVKINEETKNLLEGIKIVRKNKYSRANDVIYDALLLYYEEELNEEEKNIFKMMVQNQNNS